MLTREQKDAILKRLRDPNSKQARAMLIEKVQVDGKWVTEYAVVSTDTAMCCLGHEAYVLGIIKDGDKLVSRDADDAYAVLRMHNGHGKEGQLISMNDDQKLSLPEIADWFEANVQCDG